jgi:Circularly permuted ATP-grasp type 2
LARTRTEAVRGQGQTSRKITSLTRRLQQAALFCRGFGFWGGLISLMSASTRPYNEMLDAAGAPRPHCREYYQWLRGQPLEQLARKRAEADALFHRVGITFAVYGEDEGTERLIPFDIVPRILPAAEWTRLERGLRQRVRALNAFIADIYHEQKIGTITSDMCAACAAAADMKSWTSTSMRPASANSKEELRSPRG